MGESFVSPSWSAPLDLEERMRAVPAEATVKGMFFNSPIDQAAARSGTRPGRGRYVNFKDYPLTEHIAVLGECAKLAHPELPLRDGIRRIGREAFRIFLDSMAGKAIFGIAGRSFESALTLVSRAYKILGPVGTAELKEFTPAGALVEMRDIWNLADCYQVGVFEAAMDHFGIRGEILVRAHSIADVDLSIRTH